VLVGLLRMLPDPVEKGRIAFVLSGGGSLGAIQVGMMQALFEEGIRPPKAPRSSLLSGAGCADRTSFQSARGLERAGSSGGPTT